MRYLQKDVERCWWKISQLQKYILCDILMGFYSILNFKWFINIFNNNILGTYDLLKNLNIVKK